MKMRVGLRCAIGAVIAAAFPGVCHAQIRTDGTLGAAQAIAGPNFVIPQSLGRLSGHNLFFSFGTFGVGSGQSATFVTTTGGLENVVSRVTGGNVSVINGPLRLQSQGATPAFIFVNPAGIVFGGGASIDVPGAFHATTADYVRFADGRFHADPAAGSTFSSAPPEAFGFLGTSRSAIVFDNGASLATRLFQPFSITAGDLQMSDGRAAARAGEIRVVAVGDRPMDIPMAGPLPPAYGSLVILNGAQISSPSVDDLDGGTVRVSAGDITMLSSRPNSFEGTGIVSEAAYGTTASSGTVIVNASGHIAMGPSGQISASADSVGRAGTVSVSAGSVTIDGVVPFDTGTGIHSENRIVDGGGRAGSIEVDVRDNLVLLNGGEIGASGAGGSVRIDAGAMTVYGNYFNGTGVRTETVGNGDAGSILIDTRGNLTLVGGGTITSTTYDQFNAGSVTLNVGGDLAVIEGGNIASNTYGRGNAGSVRVAANNMRIGGGSFILGPTGIGSDSRGGTGNAGNVLVEARGELLITPGGLISSYTQGPSFGNPSGGQGGSVRVNASRLDIDGGGDEVITGIVSSSFGGTGHAGSVEVDVSGPVTLVGGGEISSSTHSAGNAGVVRVNAGSLLIDSAAGAGFASAIFSSATEDSTGNAGAIDIGIAENLALVNGGIISSSTAGPGRAGSIAAEAGSIVIDGFAGDIASGIVAAASRGSGGQAGSITVVAHDSISLSNFGRFSIASFASAPDPGTITPTTLSLTAPVIRLASDASLSAASSGNVPASNIRIDFGSLLSLRDAGITTDAQDGNGGFIRISGDGALVMRNAAILTSVFGLSGNGGDIDVNARALVMDTAFIQANTAARDASGGNVAIDVQALVPSGGSLFSGGQTPYEFDTLFGFNVIQAAAPTGVSGAIDISSPVLDIAGSLTALAAKVVETGGVARTLCESTGGSVLAQTGRGGLPPSARGLLRAQLPSRMPPSQRAAWAPRLTSIDCRK
jgi:filamentous hemagglutinin family protein